MGLHFCTYFDANYLSRGLALIRSIQRVAADAEIWVLCLGGHSLRALERLHLPRVTAIPLADLEAADASLLSVKETRSPIEYYFTATPALIKHVLARVSRSSIVAYADADLLFFSGLQPILRELGNGHAAIIPHRFPDDARALERFGVFNVGLVMVRNSDEGVNIVEDWRARCLEWCYDRVEGSRYADQKYLDAWPASFGGVRVIEHVGAGLAPWNWMRYTITGEQSAPYVDGDPLIFYHFHGLKVLGRRLYDTGSVSTARMPRHTRAVLYDRYVAELSTSERQLAAAGVPPVAPSRFLRYGRMAFLRQVLANLARGRRTLHLAPRRRSVT